MLLARRAPGQRGRCYRALSGFSRAPMVFPGLRPGLCYRAPSGLKTGTVFVITLCVRQKMWDTIGTSEEGIRRKTPPLMGSTGAAGKFPS
jgi:hypothetical protein